MFELWFKFLDDEKHVFLASRLGTKYTFTEHRLHIPSS